MKSISLRATMTTAALMCLGLMSASAQNSEIQLSTDKVTFDGGPATQQVKVLKGKNYILFSASDWMTCKQQKDGTLEISVKPYDFFYPREASVILTSKKTNYSKVLTVRQTDGKNRPEVKERPAGSGLLFLDQMDLSKSKPFYIKEIHKNQSVDKHPVKLKGSGYASAVETHAPTSLIFRINGAKRFQAEVGIDDEIMSRNETVTHGHAAYEALVDGKVVQKGDINLLDPDASVLNVDLTGGKFFELRFLDGASTFGDHIAIGNGRFEVSGEAPVMVTEEEMKAPEPAPAVAEAVCKGCDATCADCSKGCKDCAACKADCSAVCKNCEVAKVKHAGKTAQGKNIHKYTKLPVVKKK